VPLSSPLIPSCSSFYSDFLIISYISDWSSLILTLNLFLVVLILLLDTMLCLYSWPGEEMWVIRKSLCYSWVFGSTSPSLSREIASDSPSITSYSILSSSTKEATLATSSVKNSYLSVTLPFMLSSVGRPSRIFIDPLRDDSASSSSSMIGIRFVALATLPISSSLRCFTFSSAAYSSCSEMKASYP